MGFDGVGSVQTTPPFTCSKKTNVPTGRFSFWKIKCLLTRVEGGENRESDLFAQIKKYHETLDGNPND